MSLPGEVEERMGIEPLDKLLHERAELIKELAPLRARHAAFGTWDDLRRVERSTIAMRLRAQAVADNRKVTEAWLEDAAQADSVYIAFITEGTLEKVRWHELEDRVQAINDQIMRGQSISRYLAAEVALSR